MVAFLDAVDVRSAVLVGSSSGGYVAQQVALEHPDRVAGLVLVGAPRSLRGRPAFADEVEAVVDPVDPAGCGSRWRGSRCSTRCLRRTSRTGSPTGPGSPRTSGGRLAGLVTATPPTEVGTIAVPTLVLWGERDDLLPRTDQETMAAATPGARLVTYAGTGHLVLWERPARVAADVTAFVAALPPT